MFPIVPDFARFSRFFLDLADFSPMLLQFVIKSVWHVRRSSGTAKQQQEYMFWSQKRVFLDVIVLEHAILDPKN